MQRSQGKWYPGEALPRWQIGLIWRTDSRPLWQDPTLLADPFDSAQADEHAPAAAEQLARAITAEFGLPSAQLQGCFEDPLAALVAEVRRPAGPRPDTDPEVPSHSLVTELDQTETTPVAWALPLIPAWFGAGWASATWRTRRGRLVLVPGDSPAGMRLPLGSVTWVDPDYAGEADYVEAGPALDDTAPHPRPVVVSAEEASSRTALVVQARDGFVHLFLPPVEKLGKFVELVQLIEPVASRSETRVILEGYGPPPDARIKVLMVTPDPGVIEVNVHPTSSWGELSELTHTLYGIARQQRLGTETFAPDGRHSGTGGGNHITLGGAERAQSPMLRRPDLLVSLLTFWQHHPAMSYLFSGRFVGPTSQAPRFDEGRPESLYEMEISFAEIEVMTDDTGGEGPGHRPWAVDRALRHLLTDLTGNTHRAEFCIDKL